MEEEFFWKKAAWKIMLTFVLIQIICLAAGEQYDVTVMHRLDDSISESSKGYDSTRYELIPYRYRRHGQWTVVESLETPLDIQNDVERYSVEPNKMSNTLPIKNKKLDDLFIKLLAVEGVSTIYIAVSSHEILNISNYLLMQFVKNRNVLLLFDCGKGKDVIDLPEGSAKKCNKWREYGWSWSSTIGMKLKFTSKEVVDVFNTISKQMLLSKNLEFTPRFITVGSRGGNMPLNFEIYEGQYFWSLNEPREEFATGITASYGGVCLLVSYYLEPGKENYLNVLITSETDSTIITELAQCDTKQVVTARIIYKGMEGQIVLKAQKNVWSEVLISRVAECNYTDEVNITEFTMGGKTEIHSRTNALGVPFLLRDGQVVDPSVGADVAACSALKCQWTLSNWKLETASKDDIPVPPLYVTGTKYDADKTDGGNVTSYRAFNTKKTVNIEVFASTGSAAVYLLAEPGNIASSEMYAVRITAGNEAFLLKCTSSTWNRSYRIADRHSPRFCNQLSSTSFRLSQWEVNKAYVLEVSVINGKISFSAKRNGKTLVSLESMDGQPIDVKYIACATLDVRGQFIFSAQEKLYELDGDSGTMKSPMFTPSGPKLCVTITSFISSESEGVIEVTAEDPTGFIKISVGRLTSQLDFMDNQWRTDRFVADIPPELQQGQLTFSVLASKQTGHVLIQRIAGCNAEALEDVAVLSHDKPLKIYSDHGIDVALIKTVSEGLKGGDKTTCYHGGVYDENEGSCICPVGFTGRQCKQGCGPNSYGNDCGGVCSTTVDKCRNIIMCRPGLPCDCAPGFKGHTCSQECSTKEYGVGCKQRCGNCLSSSCDSYTGVCHHGCSNGYAPPFCKEELRYLKSAPTFATSSFYEASVYIDLREENMMGEGDALFYQLQYKESESNEWLKLKPLSIPYNTMQPILQNVSNLKPGTRYDFRVLIICSGGEHSSEDSLSVSSFITQCLQPVTAEYNFSLTYAAREEFQLDWKYTVENDTICHAVRYEVYRRINWQWELHEETNVPYTIVRKVLPGSNHQIKILTFTVNGPTRFSQVFSVTTQDGVPGYVVQLHAESTPGNSGFPSAESYGEGVSLMWQPPSQTEGMIDHYVLSYQCRYYAACSYHSCDHDGQLQVKKTSAVLRDLKPHANYIVFVAAVSGDEGPATNIYLTTRSAAPDTGPEPSLAAVSNVTNSSFVANWKEPSDCTMLNGYLYGYHYQLLLADNSSTVAQGFTDNTQAAFTRLLPNTDYQLRVQLLTSHGLDTRHPLFINVTTKSTVPGPVRQLAVYKRSRKVLGVRWVAPTHVSGTLESFTLSYRSSNDSEDRSMVLEDTRCPAWTDAYCHTLSGLAPKTRYHITVRDRNAEVDNDGEAATVTAITVEDGVPGAPEDLQISNRSDTSLTVQWRLPQLFNGIIRSYVLSVEQTDSADSANCCQYFPLQEVAVRSETPLYSHQFSNLSSASKYTVSVSWKTVALGPSSSLLVVTRPASTSMDENIRYEDGSLYLDRFSTGDTLLRGYLVLVRPENNSDSIPVTPIKNSDLAEEISRNIDGPFYIAAEILPDELHSSVVIQLGSNEFDENRGGENDEKFCVFSQVENPPLSDGSYKATLVKIWEYSSAYSISWVETSVFTVTN